MDAGRQSALLGLAGLGFNYAVSRYSRGRYKGPAAVVPVSKTAIHDAQIANLRRLINLNKQQISTYSFTNSWGVPASTSFGYTDINITNALCASTDYPKTVLGDQFVNKWLKFRCDCQDTSFSRIRVVLYWTQDAGNGWVPTAITDIPDPASYTVIKDFMMFPSFTGHISGLSQAFSINLKNRKTLYNYSTSQIKKGELRCVVMANNTATSAKAFNTSYRLFYANK